MQTTTSGRGHFQSTKAEQVWERGPDGVGTCLGRGASTGTGGEGHTGWEEAQHTSAPKTVVVVSDDSALQYGHAGATGHAVVRLDDLNTRSYHRAVLELTNRREKLLGKRNPSGAERRILKWKFWSMWQILGWWQLNALVEGAGGGNGRRCTRGQGEPREAAAETS